MFKVLFSRPFQNCVNERSAVNLCRITKGGLKHLLTNHWPKKIWLSLYYGKVTVRNILSVTYENRNKVGDLVPT